MSRRRSAEERPHAAGRGGGKLRFAVAGLGYIAQAAVLPSFAHARDAELVALVSGDPVKRKKLGAAYGVSCTAGYDEFEECLEASGAEAVYVALPNSLHREFAIRAFEAGCHVLCEKPMAVTEDECLEMIESAHLAQKRLMVAYRLHFEKANLEAIAAVRDGAIGDPRLFSSNFTMQVRDPGNIRLRWDTGGGTLYDLGVYCINAARALFAAEPIEVAAFTANGDEPRFAEIEEMTSAILRFPGERLAHFCTSFGAAPQAFYEVVGTKGVLRLESAYAYDEPMRLTIRGEDGRTTERSYPVRDQFGPELVYFAECVRGNRRPEPSGEEGLADVRVVQALYHAAATARAVNLREFRRSERPGPGQEIHRPPVRPAVLVHVTDPSV